mmetsp:Transcript_96045/g.132105  ORF Transcript_96045/g.132105 Transcript_96045/m.132105 type:complete len:114 (+) Transcript_96045:867-1208(+)
MEFEPPCTLSELACHKKHILHEECLNDWLKHNDNKNSKSTCPICRVEIQRDKVVKKKMIPSELEDRPDPFMGMAMDKSAYDNKISQELSSVRPDSESALLMRDSNNEDGRNIN